MNYTFKSQYNFIIILIYHIIMAKCFDHIWSTSGQPTYKNINI